MMAALHTQMACAAQNFILSHFMNRSLKVYCGHKGEAYEGKVSSCADGILTLDCNGKKIFIACDKIESMQEP